MARSRRMELLARLPPTWRARFLQLGFNWHPAFRATGASSTSNTRSKLTNALLERHLGVAGTARNWNTVLKLADLASEG